jgi:hypothetical protein
MRIVRISGETTTDLRLHPTAALREQFKGLALTDIRRALRR